MLTLLIMKLVPRRQEFLATKEMTQTAFIQQIEVGSSSFNRFMNYKGADRKS
jgi:hypothetical protein